MKLITISGVDGSGKSTQIKLLQDYLESQGKRVFYYHAIEFGIATKLATLKKKYCPICEIKGLRNIENTQKKKAITEASWSQIQLRKIFLSIDIQRFQKMLKQLKKEDYDFVLSDRYFYDNIINIYYLEKKALYMPEEKIIHPDLALFMDIRPRQILEREKAPEQGLDYLRAKTALFRANLEKWNLQIINADKPMKDVFDEILRKISVLK